MEFVYLLVHDQGEWEDSIIFLSKGDAIAKLIKIPNQRVEIFGKNENGGYTHIYI